MQIELEGVTGRRGVSLTPLIDVVFILLIFFILESHFLKLHELRLNLPENKATTQAASGGLTIELRATGDLWINGLSLNQHEFTQYLQAKAFSSDTRVLLITDPEVALQTLVRSIDTLSQHSLTRVQIHSGEFSDL